MVALARTVDGELRHLLVMLLVTFAHGLKGTPAPFSNILTSAGDFWATALPHQMCFDTRLPQPSQSENFHRLPKPSVFESSCSG